VPELLARWQRLIEMYPDMPAAQFGYAQDAWMMANRFEEGLPHARAASIPQGQYFAKGPYLEGMLQLGEERYDKAIEAFADARRRGFKRRGPCVRECLRSAAGLRNRGPDLRRTRWLPAHRQGAAGV
jgi:hypothetical protein